MAFSLATPTTAPMVNSGNASTAPIRKAATPIADSMATGSITGRPQRRATLVTRGVASRPTPFPAAMMPFTSPGASKCLRAIVTSSDDSSGSSTPSGTDRARSSAWALRTRRGSSLGFIAAILPH